jgi:cytochrome c oxidase subunit 3
VTEGAKPYYFVPAPSRHPASLAFGMLLIIFGASQWINGASWASWIVLAGFVVWIFVMQGWFRDAIGESEAGQYNKRVDVSFRWSMSWFIFSEVMFFGAFFGALFWIRQYSVPDLATIESNALVWPGFSAHWPSAGPGFLEEFSPMAAWGLPALNTLLLLTSGVTITLAHWSLIANNRSRLLLWQGITVLLGVAFLICQGIEYGHAYSELNLKLSTGAYGSTFFMLTGFHGFHVTLGAIMLTVIWFRLLKGHFTPSHHFGFEGVAWYWHFVDVVWLGLFIFVYWL